MCLWMSDGFTERRLCSYGKLRGLGNSSYEVICEGMQWHKCSNVLLLWHALKLTGFATKNSSLGLIPQPVPFTDSSSFSLKLFGVLKPHPLWRCVISLDLEIFHFNLRRTALWNSSLSHHSNRLIGHSVVFFLAYGKGEFPKIIKYVTNALIQNTAEGLPSFKMLIIQSKKVPFVKTPLGYMLYNRI